MRELNERCGNGALAGVLLTCAVFLFVSGTSVIVSGCATAAKAPPAAKSDPEEYRLESEGEVPPLPQSQVRKEVDRVDTFEEMPVTDKGIEVENVEPPPPEVAKAPAQKTMDGYRIQLIASGNEASAREVQAVAQRKLGVPAYVDLIDNIYKVRVGDCPTREQAEALLARCRASGYGDAWIVSCPIVIGSDNPSP
ncbi:MAG: SPOR domain-containing protein [bacterium]